MFTAIKHCSYVFVYRRGTYCAGLGKIIVLPTLFDLFMRMMIVYFINDS